MIRVKWMENRSTPCQEWGLSGRFSGWMGTGIAIIRVGHRLDLLHVRRLRSRENQPQRVSCPETLSALNRVVADNCTGPCGVYEGVGLEYLWVVEAGFNLPVMANIRLRKSYVPGAALGSQW